MTGGSEQRQCSHCLQEKPLSEFYADGVGKRRACKTCGNDYKKLQRAGTKNYQSREGQPCKCCVQVREAGHYLNDALLCGCGCRKSWSQLQKRGVRV